VHETDTDVLRGARVRADGHVGDGDGLVAFTEPAGAEAAEAGADRGPVPEQVATAQRELARIGIDRPAAAAVGTPEDWSGGAPLSTLRRATFGDLAVRTGEPPSTTAMVVLDVRRTQEWNAGHLTGTVHVPLHDLPRRMDEIPAGQVWVHCQSGYRASLAASLLAAAGRDVVAIDDDFTAAAAGHRLAAA
jgi:hydroxyacylglutathione hydrolase